MSFVNVFSGGPQTVYVDLNDKENGSWSWSGSLGLGGSASFSDPVHAGNTITVIVDAGGVIRLRSANAYPSFPFSIYVSVPSGANQVQVSNVNVMSSTYYSVRVQDASVSNTGINKQVLNWEPYGGVVSPNPYVYVTGDHTRVYGVYAITPLTGAGAPSVDIVSFEISTSTSPAPPAPSGWKSMFDVGPCTVTVYENGSTVAWSGVLVKGGTSPSFNDSSGHSHTVSVDASGNVTLIDTSAFVTNSSGWGIGVDPSYDVSEMYIRSSGAQCNQPNGYSGVISNSTWGGYLNLALGGLPVLVTAGALLPSVVDFAPQKFALAVVAIPNGA